MFGSSVSRAATFVATRNSMALTAGEKGTIPRVGLAATNPEIADQTLQSLNRPTYYAPYTRPRVPKGIATKTRTRTLKSSRRTPPIQEKSFWSCCSSAPPETVATVVTPKAPPPYKTESESESESDLDSGHIGPLVTVSEHSYEYYSGYATEGPIIEDVDQPEESFYTYSYSYE